MKNHILSITLITLLFAACKPAVKPGELYGKWKYIKVGKLNANPPDTVSVGELREQTPYIQFTTKDSLLIYWGGRVLSHGVFTVDGRSIKYEETLADGKTRDFPFYVSELTEKKIVFSTQGVDGSVVMAVKQ
jgi:hypothetical protein